MEPVCIIIVTYNAEKWLSKSVDKLIDIPEGCKLIVVDNCSKDETCEILRTKYPNLHLISSAKNLGFGQANNIGIQEAINKGFSWFLLLNQDAYISWQDINSLLEIAKRESTFGIISPLHLFSDTEIDFTHRRHILGKNDELLCDFLLKGSCRDIYEYKITNAAIWLLPKKTIELLGGFDPLFFHYGEDNDYCLRAIKNNLKVGICPKVIGYHYRPQDDSNFIRNQNYFYVDYLLRLIHYKKPLVFIYLDILKEIVYNIFGFNLDLNLIKFKIMALNNVIFKYYSIKSRRKKNTETFRFLNIKNF